MSPERASHLIAEYATTHCEAAFRELVDAYAGMVLAVATRVAHGDWALARDATQSVFVALARRPRAIRNGNGLGAWLHRATVRQVLQMVRSDKRRRQREAHALIINEPETTSRHSPDLQPGVIASSIDRAMDQIRESDRRILTLRYWEMKDWKSIAGACLLTEDAVQKRASRALERLRHLLARRGIRCSTAALVSALPLPLPSVHATELASRIATQAFAAATRSKGLWPLFITKTALLMTTRSKLTALAGVLIATFFGAGYLTGVAATNNHPSASARQNPPPTEDGRVKPEPRQAGSNPRIGHPDSANTPVGVVSDFGHVAIPRGMADELAKGRLFGGPNGRPSQLSEQAVALLGLDAETTTEINSLLGKLAEESLSIQRRHTEVLKDEPEEQMFEVTPFYDEEGKALEESMRSALGKILGDDRSTALLEGFPHPTSEAGAFFGLGRRTLTFKPTADGFNVRDEHLGGPGPNPSRSVSSWDTDTMPEQFKGLLSVVEAGTAK